MDVRGRPAGTEDLAQLAELRRLLVADLAGRRGGPALASTLLGGESLADRLARAVSGDACLLAGTLDGLVVGMASVTCAPGPPGSPGARTAVLDLLYVAPPARRVGVATELMASVARWGSERGCADLDAPALPGDRALKSFFEAHGLRARLLVLNGPMPDPGD